MNVKRKRLILMGAVATFATLLALGFAYTRIEWPRPESKLETTIASLPLGISPEEADSIIGGAPDTVTQQDGVLANPVTMYTASNQKGAKFGEPQTYSMRMWERDGVKAVVAVDREGKVAGRWTWR